MFLKASSFLFDFHTYTELAELTDEILLSAVCARVGCVIVGLVLVHGFFSFLC